MQDRLQVIHDFLGMEDRQEQKLIEYIVLCLNVYDAKSVMPLIQTYTEPYDLLGASLDRGNWTEAADFWRMLSRYKRQELSNDTLSVEAKVTENAFITSVKEIKITKDNVNDAVVLTYILYAHYQRTKNSKFYDACLEMVKKNERLRQTILMSHSNIIYSASDVSLKKLIPDLKTLENVVVGLETKRSTQISEMKTSGVNAANVFDQLDLEQGAKLISQLDDCISSQQDKENWVSWIKRKLSSTAKLVIPFNEKLAAALKLSPANTAIWRDASSGDDCVTLMRSVREQLLSDYKDKVKQLEYTVILSELYLYKRLVFAASLPPSPKKRVLGFAKQLPRESRGFCTNLLGLPLSVGSFLTYVLILGFIFTPLKNILKLFTEDLPKKAGLKLEKHIDKSYVAFICYYVMLGWYLCLRPLTSPRESIKKAWHSRYGIILTFFTVLLSLPALVFSLAFLHERALNAKAKRPDAGGGVAPALANPDHVHAQHGPTSQSTTHIMAMSGFGQQHPTQAILPAASAAPPPVSVVPSVSSLVITSTKKPSF